MAVTEVNALPPRRARDNPFAVDRVLRIRYRLAPGALEDLCERLAVLNWRAAIVGPEGTGKTTLLEDIARRLETEGWRIRGARLSVEFPRFDRRWLRKFFADLGERDIIAFDGAEQLSRFAWQRFEHRSSHAGGLLITTHQPGLLPTLYETNRSLDVLPYMLERLVPDAPASLLEEAERLFHKRDGNIREVIRDLYDCWARSEIAAEKGDATSSSATANTRPRRPVRRPT